MKTNTTITIKRMIAFFPTDDVDYFVLIRYKAKQIHRF